MRRIFSQAVPGNEGRLQTLLRQHAKRSHRRRQNGGLSNFRQPKLLFRAFEAKLRELVAEGFVGFFEGLAGDGIFLGQFFAHADRLRSLAGKEKSDVG